VLSEPDSAQAVCSKVTLRPIALGDRKWYQISRQVGLKVLHENLAPDGAASLVIGLLGNEFRQAALFTATADHTLTRRRDGTVRIRTLPPSKPEAVAATHNRSKPHPIPENVPCDFLEAVGVMTPTGQVRREKYHKYRQINRYLELLDDVIDSLRPEPDLEPWSIAQPLNIIDFGCGKSYLTFALYHWLVGVKGCSANIVGLDLKADVIADCQRLAERLNWNGSLKFQTGSIAEFQSSQPVDMVVSLHACDTATDEALAQAVRWKSRVIFAVPCCQHELAPQIQSPDLKGLLRHGLLHERFAALATDALRAAVLEEHGYRTQLVEFIDLEHTPKNILIRAIRRAPGERPSPENQATLERFKRLLGIERCRLEVLLESLQRSG